VEVSELPKHLVSKNNWKILSFDVVSQLSPRNDALDMKAIDDNCGLGFLNQGEAIFVSARNMAIGFLLTLQTFLSAVDKCAANLGYLRREG